MNCILRKAFLPTFALLTLGAAAHAQTVITDIPVGSGTIGTSNSILGQTFTTPADKVLTSFAFQLSNTAPLNLSIYAYAPATNTTIGPALFTSAPTGNTLVLGQNGYAFNTGNLVLTTGSVYAALLTGGASYSGPASNSPGVDGYTGGTLIVGNATTGPFQDFSVIFGSPIDTAFRATFISPAGVPEPGSIALLVGMGVMGAGSLRRRRKTRA